MTTDFFRLVESHAGGVFRCHVNVSERALAFAAQNRMRVVPVKLAGARDKNAFLKAIARALQFPDYFGQNWDGFYDCLIDMEHAEDEAGTLLVLREASGFARGEPDEFAAAAAALQDASDYWKNEDKVLTVVVELDTPALAPELAPISLPAM
jgi:hypothetical protein